jgi:hypothetical protein
MAVISILTSSLSFEKFPGKLGFPWPEAGNAVWILSVFTRLLLLILSNFGEIVQRFEETNFEAPVKEDGKSPL